MNRKIISSVIVLICIVLTTFGIIKLRDRNSDALSQKGLVIVGKAPSFSFINQNEQMISNESFKGKIYVVDFFFTTCPTICPIMTTYMTHVQNAFPDNSIGIASFTIDPGTDTPEVLRQYAEKYGVTNPNWHFLTGNEEAVYKLSNVGFNIYAEKGNIEEGGFEHSGLFALIDQNGNIVSRKDANGQPIIYYKGTEKEGVAMLIEDIKKLQN